MSKHHRSFRRNLHVLTTCAIAGSLLTVSGLSTSAASHREAPLLTVVGGDDAVDLEMYREAVVDGASLWRFRGVPGTDLERVRVDLLDACAPAGWSSAYGANGTAGPLTLEIVGLPGEDLLLPAGTPAAPTGFAIRDPLDCAGQPAAVTDDLADITGMARFDGVGRRCGGFRAPFAFGSSSSSDGYDTLTLRGEQVNDIILDGPLTTLDRSDAFDELYVFEALDQPIGRLPRLLEATVIGGPPGSLPGVANLLRTFERLDPTDRASLAASAVRRVRADKKPSALTKAVKAKRNTCTYHTRFVFDEDVDEAALHTLIDQVAGQPEPLPMDDRFRVEVDWEGADVVSRRVVAPPSETGDLWFFAPDAWELLVKVLDGCDLNDHYWVFYAATTNVEFEVTITDTVTDTVRTFDPTTGAPPVMDTQAFATCP